MAEELTQDISPTEQLSRFIFIPWYIKSGKVQFQAYMARESDDEISVSRISGLDTEGIWEEGKGVGKVSGRTLEGRADFKWEDIQKAVRGTFFALLNIRCDPRRLRHALIGKLPDSPEARREIALIYAQTSSAHRHSP